MIPRKHKEFYKSTADKLGLDKDLVELIVDFYWLKVRKTMEEQKEHRINITQIGDFCIMHNKLKGVVINIQEALAIIPPNDFNKFPRYNMLSKKLEHYKAILDRIEQEFKERQELKNNRDENKEMDD
jgi:nucleoid DNA-binding protein